jgi:hypothetical protein
MKRKEQTLKEQADIVITLSDVKSPVLQRMASAHIKMNGFYTYTKAETNEKVFVLA